MCAVCGYDRARRAVYRDIRAQSTLESVRPHEIAHGTDRQRRHRL